jgi:hypothetical protein
MKYGIEVEGRLRGVKTLFMDANEPVQKVLDFLYSDEGRGIGHIYICDHENTLNYRQVAYLFKGFHVTLEVSKVEGPELRLGTENLSIMFRIDLCPTKAIYKSISLLSSLFDQVKIEKDKKVYVFPFSSVITTLPNEFEGDVEI